MSGSCNEQLYSTCDTNAADKTLHIYDPTESQLTRMFSSTIRKTIKEKRGFIKFQEVGPGDVDNCTLLLVMCLNHSRLGTDIDHAVFELTAYNKKKVAVLVLHAKDPHALPLTMPTEHLLDEKYAQFGKLIDFAGTSERGVYSCNMNRTGYDKLDNFLEDHLPMSTESGIDIPCVENKPRRLHNLILSILAPVVLSLVVCGIVYWSVA